MTDKLKTFLDLYGIRELFEKYATPSSQFGDEFGDEFTNAFSWSKTKEGYNYWYHFFKKWGLFHRAGQGWLEVGDIINIGRHRLIVVPRTEKKDFYLEDMTGSLFPYLGIAHPLAFCNLPQGTEVFNGFPVHESLYGLEKTVLGLTEVCIDKKNAIPEGERFSPSLFKSCFALVRPSSKPFYVGKGLMSQLREADKELAAKIKVIDRDAQLNMIRNMDFEVEIDKHGDNPEGEILHLKPIIKSNFKL